jgi:hypothetical protein
MKLAVNEDFMASSFDVEVRLSFDVPAEPGWSPFGSTGYLTGGTYTMRMQKAQMKYIAAMALMFNLGVASVYAQQHPVKMAVSGTDVPTTVNLQLPNTLNDEANYTGNGTLGPFTFHYVRAIAPSLQLPSTCSGPNKIAGSSVVGAGVFSFQDGSQLKANLTQGSDCIDLASGEAHCTLTFQITSGTGRFKNASGDLTLTETVVPVLADALGNPVFYAATGEFTGIVSGVGRDGDHHEDGQ